MQKFFSALRKLCMAQWFLFFAIATPGVCQTTIPEKGTGDICNWNKSPDNPKQGIVSQTELNKDSKKTWRPLPVSNQEDPKNSAHYFHKRDYIVVVYDAENHVTAYYDYDTPIDEFTRVPNNGAFLPVTFTKEKILVRVCNLHPTDTVSIAGTSFSLPEQGADIRGATPNTVPVLAPTLDTLGSASAAGSPFSPAGVNFGSSAPLTSIAISGFTFGSANKDTGYTDAVINVSPEALAFETVSLIRDAQDVVHTIKELNRGDPLNPPVAGSISTLQDQANQLIGKLKEDPTTMDGAAKLGWFNHRLADTQQLVTDLNGLANGVSQAGLGARAVAIRQNFESILGVLKQIHQVIEDDKKIDKSLWSPVAPASATGTAGLATKAAIGGTTTSTTTTTTDSTTTKSVTDKTTSADKTTSTTKTTSTDKTSSADKTAKKPEMPLPNCEDLYNKLVQDEFTTKQSIPADTFTCRAYERYIMTTFLHRFNQKMGDLLTTIAIEQVRDIAKRSKDSFAKLTDAEKATTNVSDAQKAVTDAEIAINAASAQQTHAIRSRAERDQAVIDTQKPRKAVAEDDLHIAALDAQLKQTEESAKAAEQARKLQQQNNAAEQSPAVLAQDIQQSATDAKLSADLTKDMTDAITTAPHPNGIDNAALEKTASIQSSQAQTDEAATATLATNVVANLKSTPTEVTQPSPPPPPPLPQINDGALKTNPQASSVPNSAGALPDKAAQEAAEAARKKHDAAQVSLKNAKNKRDVDQKTLDEAVDKADCAEKDFEGDEALAADKFRDAVTPAERAAAAVKAAAGILPTSNPRNQADEVRSMAYQWHQAAEDIGTYASYLGLLYPHSNLVGDQLQPGYGEQLAQDNVVTTYYEILKMRSDLTSLDDQVSTIFSTLNKDYRNTFVEQTDALPPFSGNATERVSINVQRNYTPFTITGGATVGAASTAAASSASGASPSGGVAGGGAGGGGKGAGGGAGAASGAGGGAAGAGAAGGAASPPSSSSAAVGSNDVTVFVEVHRRATFNMVGGVMAILVPTNSYSVVQQDATYLTTTTGTTSSYQPQGSCNGGSTLNIGNPVTSPPTTVTPYYCIESTQTGSIQLAGMAGVEWFLWPRDYYPYGRGVGSRKENWKPSLLVASSITSLGSAFFGPNIEPVNGFNFFGGIASAHQQTVSSTMLKTVYLPVGSSGAAPIVTPVTHEKWGFSFGVGFDLSVFTQLFSKTSGPQLP